MKKVIAGLVAGLVLGSVSTAGAATNWTYWVRGGASYTCTGIETGVICKEKPWSGVYRVSITPSFVGIFRGSHAVYGCDRGFKDEASACFSDN